MCDAGFSLNGRPLAEKTTFKGRLRALLATQASAPGYFIVVEQSRVSVRRSHDLSMVGEGAEVGRSAATGVRSAALYERGGGGGAKWLEVFLGLENGQVAVCVLDVRGAAV